MILQFFANIQFNPKNSARIDDFFLSSNFLKQYQLFADDATMHPTLRGIKTLGDHMSMIRPNRAKSMMMLDSTYIDGLDEVNKNSNVLVQLFLELLFYFCFIFLLGHNSVFKFIITYNIKTTSLDPKIDNKTKIYFYSHFLLCFF